MSLFRADKYFFVVERVFCLSFYEKRMCEMMLASYCALLRDLLLLEYFGGFVGGCARLDKEGKSKMTTVI